MNINLTPELEKLIQDKVRSGLYNNQSEVVREALRLLVEQDRRQEAHRERLRSSLAEGLRQADRGDLLTDEQVIREIRDFLEMRRNAAAPR